MIENNFILMFVINNFLLKKVLCQIVRKKKILITYIDKGQHQLTHVKSDQGLYLPFTELLDTIAPDKAFFRPKSTE